MESPAYFWLLCTWLRYSYLKEDLPRYNCLESTALTPRGLERPHYCPLLYGYNVSETPSTSTSLSRRDRSGDRPGVRSNVRSICEPVRSFLRLLPRTADFAGEAKTCSNVSLATSQKRSTCCTSVLELLKLEIEHHLESSLVLHPRYSY